MNLSTLGSKKLFAGPVASTALLLDGKLDGWQWVAVNIGYVLVQGAVDAIKARMLPPVVDQQSIDTPKP